MYAQIFTERRVPAGTLRSALATVAHASPDDVAVFGSYDEEGVGQHDMRIMRHPPSSFGEYPWWVEFYVGGMDEEAPLDVRSALVDVMGAHALTDDDSIIPYVWWLLCPGRTPKRVFVAVDELDHHEAFVLDWPAMEAIELPPSAGAHDPGAPGAERERVLRSLRHCLGEPGPGHAAGSVPAGAADPPIIDLHLPDELVMRFQLDPEPGCFPSRRTHSDRARSVAWMAQARWVAMLELLTRHGAALLVASTRHISVPGDTWPPDRMDGPPVHEALERHGLRTEETRFTIELGLGSGGAGEVSVREHVTEVSTAVEHDAVEPLWRDLGPHLASPEWSLTVVQPDCCVLLRQQRWSTVLEAAGPWPATEVLQCTFPSWLCGQAEWVACSVTGLPVAAPTKELRDYAVSILEQAGWRHLRYGREEVVSEDSVRFHFMADSSLQHFDGSGQHHYQVPPPAGSA